MGGVISPVLGGLVVLILSEGLESLLDFVVLLGNPSGIAILIIYGVFVACTMCPIGIFMGIAAYQFMRKDVWL